MTDMPEKIWADEASLATTGDWWGVPVKGLTEYTRSDLAPQWQSIETAPKDGTEIIGLLLAYTEAPRHSIVRWSAKDEWWIAYAHGDYVTELVAWDMDPLMVEIDFWMPLPNPPEDAE